MSGPLFVNDYMTTSDPNYYFFALKSLGSFTLWTDTLIYRFACVVWSFRLIGCDKTAHRKKQMLREVCRWLIFRFNFNLKQKRFFSNCFEVNKNIYNNYSKRHQNKWNICFATLQYPVNSSSVQKCFIVVQLTAYQSLTYGTSWVSLNDKQSAL